MLNHFRPDRFGFVGIDGDKVGDRIVHALIANDAKELQAFAAQIAAAVEKIKETLVRNGYHLIIITGDGVVAQGPIDKILFRDISKEFLKITQCTLSIGAGRDLRSVFLALKLAKSRGGNIIILNDEIEPCRD